MVGISSWRMVSSSSSSSSSVFLFLLLLCSYCCCPSIAFQTSSCTATRKNNSGRLFMSNSSSSSSSSSNSKGKILVLGGTGYLGQNVCQQAIAKGYSVVSLSRRGLPPTDSNILKDVDYRQGDARQPAPIQNILEENNDIVGIVHCIGLLFDDASGLGNLNKFVSGSGSLPDSESTYDTITRITAFNAIEAAVEYAQQQQQQQQQRQKQPLPFVFTSAAEAGWPYMTGGPFIESIMPEFIGRYMVAKRAVESKLMNDDKSNVLRPIIVRPSLIYNIGMDKITSLPPVAAFTIANALRVPFVDKPVTVTALSKAIIESIKKPSIQGILRYTEIEKLGA